MTQPMIELLPCPFCGGTAGMRENGIGDYYVKCFVCEAKSSDYRCEEPTHAAGRWNRRAALTAQAGDGVDDDDENQRCECCQKLFKLEETHCTEDGWFCDGCIEDMRSEYEKQQAAIAAAKGE